MEKELSKWTLSARVYATLYVILRAVLIISSAIVAAQNNLKGSAFGFLVAWVPILALTVVIATGIDTWQRPQLKWRGFMEDRDGLESLVICLQAGKEDENKLLKEFDDIRKKHRAEHVF